MRASVLPDQSTAWGCRLLLYVARVGWCAVLLHPSLALLLFSFLLLDLLLPSTILLLIFLILVCGEST